MVPVPTPENKVLSGKQVKEEQLSFLSPSITTKQDVLERLGNPTVIWEDARVFVYRWEMRQGILFWAVGAYYSGALGMTDLPKKYLFLIRFDEQDRVRLFEKTVCPPYRSYADCLIEWVGDGSKKAPRIKPDEME
jgi:outer membrane protein assembly factor BamE (lipoprotein component of BamABCDE complex)